MFEKITLISLRRYINTETKSLSNIFNVTVVIKPY